jgi:predicted TIM-barrel fold metal-dependent hydrolase
MGWVFWPAALKLIARVRRWIERPFAVLDRLAREQEYGGLRIKRKPVDYFTSGKLFCSCEGNEKAVAYAIERVGPEPFMFASDFPHEISLDNCSEEIEEIIARRDLREEPKAAILGDNARRFYKI